MLLLIQGPTDTKALRARLFDIGFARGSVGVSLPSDWSKARPKDWPNEGIYGLLTEQSLIRVSGLFGARSPVRVDPEIEIEPGAVMRILETWDHDAPGAQTGAASTARSSSSSSSSSTDDKSKKVLIGAAAIAAVAVGWNWLSGRKKLEREQERFENLAAKAEREEITRRVHELTAGGMDRFDALARAESEAEGKDDRDDDVRVIVLRP